MFFAVILSAAKNPFSHFVFAVVAAGFQPAIGRFFLRGVIPSERSDEGSLFAFILAKHSPISY
jgi:hypothetical protein